MVKIDTTKQKLFTWLAGPVAFLAFISVILGLFSIASVLFMGIVIIVIITHFYSKYNHNPNTVFSYVNEQELVIIPHAYLFKKPIKIKIDSISSIQEGGKQGKRKFLIHYNSKTLLIDLTRMIGMSSNAEVENEFLSFLNKNIKVVEHVYAL